MNKKEATKEAEKILEKDENNWTIRSCWECNKAHEHLKKCKIPVKCFWCGKCYYKGIDITDYGERDDNM